MKPFWLSLIFIFLLFPTTYSQSEEGYLEEGDYMEEEVYEPVNLNFYEISFATILPSGRFKEKVDRSMFLGFNFSYLRQLEKEKPAFFGVEIYHSFMGTLARSYEQIVDNEILFLDGSMSSNALGLNLVGRYYPSLKFGPVEPFIEAHFGPKWLYSYQSESGVFSNEETYNRTDFLQGDFVLAYGGAMGFQIYLNQNIYFSIKGSYQISNSAEYYKRIEDEFNVFPLFPIDGFEIVNSTTNNMKLDIGFTFLY